MRGRAFAGGDVALRADAGDGPDSLHAVFSDDGQPPRWT